MIRLTKKERRVIDPLLSCYKAKLPFLTPFHEGVFRILTRSTSLRPLVHSFRERIKDPEHLKEKLRRKMRECEEDGTRFKVSPNNLLTKINDLSGIRILHLHTSQVADIDEQLKRIFK